MTEDQTKDIQEAFATALADLFFAMGVRSSQEESIVEKICLAIDRYDREAVGHQAIWRAVMHTHDARGDDPDTCLKCGYNFRNEMHRRVSK